MNSAYNVGKNKGTMTGVSDAVKEKYRKLFISERYKTRNLTLCHIICFRYLICLSFKIM